MKKVKMLLPVLVLLLVSLHGYAQQSKKSDALNTLDKKERTVAKEAAHARPTNKNDQIVEKKDFKKNRVRQKRAESQKAKPHKDGRYPQKAGKRKVKRHGGKGLKIHNKTQKQAPAQYPENQ